MTTKRSTFGVVGLTTGAIALLVALLSFWALPILIPPKPIEQVVVEKALDIRQRLVERIAGIESKEQRDNEIDWYRICAVVAVALGAAAIVLAGVSFARRENLRISAVAALLGTGAIVAQFLILILAAIVLLVLIALVLPKVLESMQ